MFMDIIALSLARQCFVLVYSGIDSSVRCKIKAHLRLWLVLVLALGGCQDLMMDANPGATTKPAQPIKSATPADGSPGARYYQLILVNEAGISPDVPGIKQIRALHVNPRSLGELISRLYLPAGPSGTKERYALIYPSIQECNTAAESVKELDVVATSINAGDEQTTITFAQSIGFYFAAQISQADTAAWPSVLQQLKHAANETSASAWRKWAANMAAGAVASERLYDYGAAALLYEQAERVASPGSLEQMNALYQRARSLLQIGDNSGGRRLLTQIVGQFAMFRSSEVFERARQMLADMDRGR
jgi:hypothetical protein